MLSQIRYGDAVCLYGPACLAAAFEATLCSDHHLSPKQPKLVVWKIAIT